MKIKLELFGASRDFSNQDFIEFNIKKPISIKEFKNLILEFIEKNFKGNENYKKIVKGSVFCSEDDRIISDNYKITKDQRIGIIPPIGGG
ncbi:MAG: molybdopterin biosynthesis protein MoeD [Pelagibacteraceae bacterium BACL5 MAG-120705-bin12]|jgi:sulfur-carrier protein|nr:MAG: molybdopterin biosynthesis protein MoeD [Pelagibacteraceae bacterium BACL5 MAG-120705-bin12]